MTEGEQSERNLGSSDPLKQNQREKNIEKYRFHDQEINKKSSLRTFF